MNLWVLIETDYGIEGINDSKRELQRGAEQAIKIEKWGSISE